MPYQLDKKLSGLLRECLLMKVSTHTTKHINYQKTIQP